MATQSSRSAGNGRKPATAARAAANREATPQSDKAATEAAAPPESERDNTLEGALDAWSNSASKEYLAWQIATCTALLRGAQALRSAQLEAAQRAEAAHEEAAKELLSVSSLGDLATVQLELARSDAEGAVQYWTDLGGVATKSLLETLSEAASGWMRMNNAAWGALAQWPQLQSLLPQNADVLEAEVEHMTSPLAASPMMWPAQEATRQAMTLASSAWNDWISWSGHLADAGRSLGERNQTH